MENEACMWVFHSWSPASVDWAALLACLLDSKVPPSFSSCSGSPRKQSLQPLPERQQGERAPAKPPGWLWPHLLCGPGPVGTLSFCFVLEALKIGIFLKVCEFH